MSCVFCDIVDKNERDIIKYSDEEFVAFKDISPAAAVHLLLIPKNHISNIKELNENHAEMLCKMKEIALKLLNEHNVKPEDHLIGFHVPPFMQTELLTIYNDKPFGITCATITNGSLNFNGLYGYSKVPFWPFLSKTKVQQDTRFQVGEISQVLTSLAILRLVDQGLVDLDGDITQYIADLHFKNDSGEKVSVRKLVNHTVQIEYQSVDGYPANIRLPSIQELLLGKSIKKEIVIKSVGKYSYNEAGYILLQRIIESVTTKPFHQVMYEQILAPCQMRDSSFETTGNLSVGHIWYGNPIYFRKRRYPFAIYPQSVKGLWSTSKDLALFLIQFCNCVNEEWGSLLSPLTAVNLKSASSNFFGWHLENNVYSVQGETTGFKSIIRVNPKQNSGFVLIRNHQNYENEFVQFHNLLAKSANIPVELKLERELTLRDLLSLWKLIYVCFSTGILIYVLGQVNKVAQMARTSNYGTGLLVGAFGLKFVSLLTTLYFVHGQFSDFFDDMDLCTSDFDILVLYFDILTNILVEISIFIQYLIYARGKTDGFSNTFYSLWDFESWLYLGILLANLGYFGFSFSKVDNPSFYYILYTTIPTLAIAVSMVTSIDTSKKVLDSGITITSSSPPTAEKIRIEYEKKSVLKPNKIYSSQLEKHSNARRGSYDSLLKSTIHHTSFASLSAINESNSRNDLEPNEEQNKYLSPAFNRHNIEVAHSRSERSSPAVRRHTFEKGHTKVSPKFVLPNKDIPEVDPKAQKQIERFSDKPSFKYGSFKNGSFKSEQHLSIEKKFAEYFKEDVRNSDISLEQGKKGAQYGSKYQSQDWVTQMDNDE
ncbi:hypothetical protein HDV06_004453 [Boothiomyces sp. JEL0866]|nr:hypothetical protein HDV06_004453 [Boothiomyces sp. JEL0866]